MKKQISFGFLLLITLSDDLAAQNFVTIGTARPMQNSCILLTPDEPYAEGIAYSSSKLNLEEPFEISFDIYLGDKDLNGADGIAFIIHNDFRQFEAFGTWGESLGYGRMNPWGRGNSISPSIAIEFDTYFNPRQNDPESDHVAYLENGSSFHQSFWNGGVDDFNIENGLLHDFRFRWTPSTREVLVTLNGLVVYKGTRNLISDIFDGETNVIWGFSASTGRLHNQQYFCLRRLASVQELESENFE